MKKEEMIKELYIVLNKFHSEDDFEYRLILKGKINIIKTFLWDYFGMTIKEINQLVEEYEIKLSKENSIWKS